MQNNTEKQSIKADYGKPKLTLVPRKIIFDIAKVREYGAAKYHEEGNWKNVDPERYQNAAFRHFMAYLDDPEGVDEESGLPHLAHLACNIAFLCEFAPGGSLNPIEPEVEEDLTVLLNKFKDGFNEFSHKLDASLEPVADDAQK